MIHAFQLPVRHSGSSFGDFISLVADSGLEFWGRIARRGRGRQGLRGRGRAAKRREGDKPKEKRWTGKIIEFSLDLVPNR